MKYHGKSCLQALSKSFPSEINLSADPADGGKLHAPQRGMLVLADLARIGNVSESTVSRALTGSRLISQATRERIVKLAEANGYVTNALGRSLRLGHTGILALVMPSSGASSGGGAGAVLSDLIPHLATAANRRGYELLLAGPAQQRDRVSRILRERRADGVIMGEYEDVDLPRGYAPPVVVWGRSSVRRGLVAIGPDECRSGWLATTHLLRAGCRKVAFVADSSIATTRRRLRGYQSALREMKCASEVIIELPTPNFRVALKQVLLGANGLRTDGFVVSVSDEAGLNLIDAIHDIDRPTTKNIAIIGTRQPSGVNRLGDNVATTHIDFADAAKLLVDSLVRIIDGRQVASRWIEPLVWERCKSRHDATADNRP